MVEGMVMAYSNTSVGPASASASPVETGMRSAACGHPARADPDAGNLGFDGVPPREDVDQDEGVGVVIRIR
jgi:hypothetical protein